MSTIVTKVTAGQVVSASVKYDNSGDPERRFAIGATVRIESGRVSSFDGGRVDALPPEGQPGDPGTFVASFNAYGDGSLHMDIQSQDREASLQAMQYVYAFMEDCRAAIETDN